jgi:hypothetical protein
MHLYNAAGVLVASSQHQLEKGHNDLIIPETSQWKPGTYFLSANAPGIPKSTVKFLKQY